VGSVRRGNMPFRAGKQNSSGKKKQKKVRGKRGQLGSQYKNVRKRERGFKPSTKRSRGGRGHGVYEVWGAGINCKGLT